MEERKISYQRLAEVTAEKLDEAKSYAEELYKLNCELNTNEIRMLAGQLFIIIDEWQKYYNQYNTIIDKDRNDYNNILAENKVLQSENNRLQKEIDSLKWKIDNMDTTIEQKTLEVGQLRERLNMMDELMKAKENASGLVPICLVEALDKLDKAVNLVEDNAKALSLSYKLKTEPRVSMHGEDHPRYRNDIDNDRLIADYQSGMILKDLSKKYKISIPGVRNRLLDLGVYKQVYKK